MTYYMYTKRPVFQARVYTAQANTEGSLDSIVAWLSGMFSQPGHVAATEGYDSSIDQMVMHLQITDISMPPVDENTPAMDVIIGDYLIAMPDGGVVKTTYDQMTRQYDIIT